MSDFINPYQAPLTSSLEPAIPPPSTVVPVRLDFQGHLTQQHYQDAVKHAGIRQDYKAVLRRRSVFALVLFAVLFFFAFNTNQGGRLLNALLSGSLLLTGLLVVVFRHYHLVTKRIPACQLIRGDVTGWIDQDTMVVIAEHYRSYHPIDSLVSAAVDDSMVVLSFGREQFFFHPLSFDFFSDPEQARLVAADLNHLYPPAKPIAVDDRKLEPPESTLYFPPPEQSIAFSGPFHLDALKGSRFYRASQKDSYWNLLSVLFMVVCTISSLGILFGSFSGVLVLGMVWFAILFGLLWLKNFLRKRQAKQKGRQVLWNSVGWIGASGFMSATTVGQSQSNWDYFDHVEITTAAIVLYPHTFDGCAHLVGREQFADDEPWEAACELVRSGMRD